MNMHTGTLQQQCPFTAKQLECVKWASMGKTSFETGAILGRNHRSVERRLQEAMIAANVTNKVGLVAKALREGWIS